MAADLGYSTLAHYVHNSLEVYRPQLQAILFPVFAHIYMKLVAIGQSEDAQDLMNTHGEEHEQAYLAEMSQLRLIVDKEHMKKNTWATRVLHSSDSFVLTVGTTAQALLAAFLEEHNLVKVLHILNSKMRLNSKYVHPATSSVSATSNTNARKRKLTQTTIYVTIHN